MSGPSNREPSSPDDASGPAGEANSRYGQPQSADRASHRFDNDLRYRDGAHPNQRQLTPPYVLDPVRVDLGGIGLDPCTEPDNPTGADVFYTVDDDGLTKPWNTGDWRPSVFCNPPYSRAKEPWVEACIAAGKHQRVVLLIPAHTDTRIFQRALVSADALVFIKGRVKFGVLRANRRQEAASHPSALIGWNVSLAASAALGYRAFGAQLEGLAL